MNKLYTLMFLLILLSCSNSRHKGSLENSEDNILVIEGAPLYADSTKFKMQILEHGDDGAYYNLTYLYEFEYKPMLPYAFIMAELHRSNLYYNDIYEGLLEVINDQKDMDPDKKEGLIRLVIYYMKLNLKDEDELTSNFASIDLSKLYEKGELVEKNPELVQYLKGGGKDIDKFREEQKTRNSKK